MIRQPAFATDADRWRAVQMRDATADSVFVYGVRTTRVYCRPNCKARLARRANVTFFDEPLAAESNGYRACKRCRPQLRGTMPEDEAVKRIRRILQQDSTASQTPSTLASQAGMSRWHFHRKFKEVTGQTPQEYLQQRRSTTETEGGFQEQLVELAHGEAVPREDDRGLFSWNAWDVADIEGLADWDGAWGASESEWEKYLGALNGVPEEDFRKEATKTQCRHSKD